MSVNPFITNTYSRIWSKHFNKSKQWYSFNFIKDVHFIKQKYFNLYVSLGVNLTGGNTYRLFDLEHEDFKNKVFLIRDIPAYHNIDTPNKNTSLKCKHISQYDGYVTKISNYDSLEHYLKSIFKSNSRYKFRRNIERLESCFDIEYVMYHGEISKKQFDNIFDEFYKLFDKRYTNKQEYCGELNPLLWNYYCELAYNMILEKTASLFVIFSNKKPISITFNYHFGTIFIEALTVFDIDYYRFNIGHTTTYKLLEWSFNNNVTLFDFTDGDFDYKKRWSEEYYKKNFHLLYDSSSIKCSLVANFVKKKFKLKQKLRDLNIIKKYKDLKYKFSNTKTLVYSKFDVDFVSIETTLIDKMEVINIYDNDYMSQRKAILDFLYKYPEPFKNLKFYKDTSVHNNFYAVSDENIYKIIKQ